MLDSIALALLVSLVSAGPCRAQEGDSPTPVIQAENHAADDIQRKILDPILGADRSSVFVRLSLTVIHTENSSKQSGSGMAKKFKRKSDAVAASTGSLTSDRIFTDFGFEDDREEDGAKRAELAASEASGGSAGAAQTAGMAAHSQTAEQSRANFVSSTTWRTDAAEFRVSVLYDRDIPAAEIDLARQALLDVYAGQLDAKSLRFIPTRFRKKAQRTNH